jgi:hypothetical protein
MGRMAWDGNERREHDEHCRNKMDACGEKLMQWVREYVQTQICIHTKGTKIWNKYMRPIMALLLAGAIAGHFTPTSSQEHVVKDTKIESRVEVIENAHREMASDVEDMKGDIEEIEKAQFIQTYILNELAKKEGIDVPSRPVIVR